MSRTKQQLRAGVLLSLCAFCVAGGYAHAAATWEEKAAELQELIMILNGNVNSLYSTNSSEIGKLKEKDGEH